MRRAQDDIPKDSGWVRPFGGAVTPIELSKQARADAIASIKRYFDENMPEPIGDLPAGLLLNYFLEEIGPVVYNRAVKDVVFRAQQRVGDLEGELFTPEFEYWPNHERKRKKR